MMKSHVVLRMANGREGAKLIRVFDDGTEHVLTADEWREHFRPRTEAELADIRASFPPPCPRPLLPPRRNAKAYFKAYNQLPEQKAKNAIRRHRRRALKRAASGQITKAEIDGMFFRQGGKCAYCARSIVHSWHIEHMTPLCRGGSNEAINICLSCATCNLRKGKMTAEEFRANDRRRTESGKPRY